MKHIFIAPIKKDMIVEASQETCFRVFTENRDSWWPKTHHIGSAPITELVLEQNVGGRWYSTHEDGNQANVGSVISWDPFDHILLNCEIDGDFKYNPDLSTEVEVQFIPIHENKTRVLMEHRHLERMGDGKAIESMDQGWGMFMELYKSRVGTGNIGSIK